MLSLGEKLLFNFGGLKGSADLEDAFLILGEAYEKGADVNKLNLKISDESKVHPNMGYTTDLDTLKLIFQFLTLRSSSLANANLNDPMEKERVGVSEYANTRFITCFCQMEHECVPFWMYYGKKIRKNKVLMQFKNFASTFEDCIHTDYVFVKDNKKCVFKSEEYGILVNRQHTDSSIKDEYDLRGEIDSMLMFDVEYVPASSPIFTDNNSGDSNIDLGKVSGQPGLTVTMKACDLTILGKQKSNPWEYEKETRILCALSGTGVSDWDYIDLRLKPEFFRDLVIVLSPWDEGELHDSVKLAIDSSNLPQEIKDSISIIPSSLTGKLNFPEYS